jgi:hypothetical protein
MREEKIGTKKVGEKKGTVKKARYASFLCNGI